MTDQLTPPAPSFTEAPLSWNCRYISKNGLDCQLTIRAMTSAELMGKITNAEDYLMQHGAQPTRINGSNFGAPPPAAPAPAGPAQSAPKAAAPAPVQDEVIKVNTIAHAVTDSGHHHVKVRGGMFSIFGVKAWSEVLPPSAAEFEQWPIGQEYAPLDGMELAVVRENKVISFRSE